MHFSRTPEECDTLSVREGKLRGCEQKVSGRKLEGGIKEDDAG